METTATNLMAHVPECRTAAGCRKMHQTDPNGSVAYLCESWGGAGGGRIYAEARHEGYAYPPLFPAAGFLRQLKQDVFATWLYMAIQTPTEMAGIPTKMAKFQPR